MKESFIQRLEQILQVNAPREDKGSWGYAPSSHTIFKTEGFDILLNNKKIHFKPVANPDLSEALKSFHSILAKDSQAEHAYNLSEIVSLDSTSKFYWKNRAAEQGHVLAQCYLGDYFYNGYGISKDYAEAVKWFRKAAEQGDANALFHLGFCYKYGYGVSRDYEKAVKWLRKAAEQGHVLAQQQLCDCFYNSNGIPID